MAVLSLSESLVIGFMFLHFNCDQYSSIIAFQAAFPSLEDRHSGSALAEDWFSNTDPTSGGIIWLWILVPGAVLFYVSWLRSEASGSFEASGLALRDSSNFLGSEKYFSVGI